LSGWGQLTDRASAEDVSLSEEHAVCELPPETHARVGDRHQLVLQLPLRLRQPPRPHRRRRDGILEKVWPLLALCADQCVSSAWHDTADRLHAYAWGVFESSSPLAQIATEAQLAALALALGASEIPHLSRAESALAETVGKWTPTSQQTREASDLIADGEDPLGHIFCSLRSPEERRPSGATYTPRAIVGPMIEWAEGQGPVANVVDPGAGSGRFLTAAARTFPSAKLIAFETDPLAALICRANIAVTGVGARTHILLQDYRSAKAIGGDGPTLTIGNPPYVRHHQISAAWKRWLTVSSRSMGLSSSQLAGLHTYFYLSAALAGRVGDRGAFVTASEWLDVNYGSLIRELLLSRLGGEALTVVEPEAMPFADATTTAAIACWRIGSRRQVMRIRRVADVSTLGDLSEGEDVRLDRFRETRRWSPLTRPGKKLPEGWIQLGDIARVHRGSVTGANGTWVVPSNWANLPEHLLQPSITRGRELIAAGVALHEDAHLWRVIDLPEDLDELGDDERRDVERFLRAARRRRVHKGYIASHRRSWWSVGLRPPAPIVASYMARRPPAFVLNHAEVRHINIAHGIYPREPLPAQAIVNMARALRDKVSLEDGRTYAGGLVKFEPREMERLPVPSLESLMAP
jgi:hypothetical protein